MSATRDEVLRAMAVAVIDKATDGEGFADSWEIPGDHPTMVIMANEMAQAALAAAEQSGWVLRPVEPTEEMIEALAIKLYEERARNRGLPMAKWENAPELVRSLERRDAATAYRLVLAAAPKATP